MEDLKETAQIITLKQEMHMRVSCVKVPCFIGPTMAFVIITATTLPLEQTQWHKRHCFLKKMREQSLGWWIEHSGRVWILSGSLNTPQSWAFCFLVLLYPHLFFFDLLYFLQAFFAKAKGGFHMWSLLLLTASQLTHADPRSSDVSLPFIKQ